VPEQHEGAPEQQRAHDEQEELKWERCVRAGVEDGAGVRGAARDGACEVLESQLAVGGLRGAHEELGEAHAAGDEARGEELELLRCDDELDEAVPD
jgi:hypothetical protein